MISSCPIDTLKNGYGALYVLVWCSTPSLCAERLNWATIPFNDDVEPSKYASIIIYLVSEAKQHYIPKEQALEMLTQVLKGSKYAKSTTKLLAELLIYNFLMPKKDLDLKFDVKNLAILFTDHLPATPTMSINAVTTGQRQNNSCSPQNTTFNQPKRVQ